MNEKNAASAQRKVAANRALLSADQISVFCYQLSLMQKAGIGSAESAAILLDDARTGWERDLLQQLSDSLATGATLSAALTETGAFPNHLIRMVEIGQASGRLDQVLESLSDFYRHESDTQNAVRRMVAYPAFMAVLIALVFLVLMARVLPVFEQVFSQLGMTLSPLAQTLLRFSSASQAVATALCILLVFAAGFALYLARTRRGNALAQEMSFTLLKNRGASRATNRSRFAAAMSLMLSSGLPLDEAMERTAQLLAGTALETPIRAGQEKMKAGFSFPTAVEQAGILDGLQAGLLAAGFRTGASEKAMAELAARCQSEADELQGRMLGRIEYAMVLILCLSIGLVLLSVMLPLLGAMSSIGA